MIDMPKADYRERLYSDYVSSGQSGAIAGAAEFEIRAPYLRQVVARYFPEDRDSRILDLGCGAGAMLHFARLGGYHALRGIDASPEQVASAKRLGLDCVERGDALAALRTAAAQSVDVIVAFDLLEHLTKDEVVDFIDTAHRALADDGRIILHLPNAESPFVGAVLYGDFTHQLAFTRHSLEQLTHAAGFRRIECHEVRPLPHGIKSSIRWALWPVFRLMLRAANAIETGDSGAGAVLSRNMLVVIEK